MPRLTKDGQRAKALCADAHREIQSGAGAGERAVIAALARHGWTLTPTASGRLVHAYELRPTPKA